jgi:hypothetical protein
MKQPTKRKKFPPLRATHEGGGSIKPLDTPASTYVAEWDARVAAGITPELVPQWHAERDQRDKLAVPIAERVRLLDLIDPVGTP